MCVSAAIGAGGQLIGAGANALTSMNASNQQGALSARAIENAETNQRNKAMLDALAIRQGRAGTSDSEGNTTQYDAGSNTWQSQLGPRAEAAQRSADQATTIANTTGVGSQLASSRHQGLMNALKDRQLDAAQGDVASFRPLTSAQSGSEASQATLAANRDALRETLGSTARQFARTGTSAGPVLSQIARGGAQSLRSGLAQDRAGAEASTAGANQARLNLLGNRVQALSGRGFTPAPTSVAGSNASQIMAQLLNQSRASATQPISSAGATIGYGTQGVNSAVDSANRSRFNNPMPANILGISKALQEILSSFKSSGSKTDVTPGQLAGSTPYDYGYF